MNSSVTINQFLTEKFDNYIKFLMSSSMSPKKMDKLLNPEVKNIDPLIKVAVLVKTYQFYIAEDKFLFDDWYEQYWLKKYEVDKNTVKKEDYEKFKRYHLMFFNLISKYQKIMEQQIEKK
jgi:hypothetical protein